MTRNKKLTTLLKWAANLLAIIPIIVLGSIWMFSTVSEKKIEINQLEKKYISDEKTKLKKTSF